LHKRIYHQKNNSLFFTFIKSFCICTKKCFNR